MSDIRRWLERHGLERYAAAFDANDIEIDTLTELTDDDLKELGLTLGHRRKFLKAVAELGSEDSSQDVPIHKAAAPSVSYAERRQLTVMFCDLVGSTALSERLDPEDLREVIGRYQETCTKVIHRYEGYIARYMGDGLLVYFGYPQAHEDDAERAVRAGLGIVEAIKALEPQAGLPLKVRIGIATGSVVVGDIIGEGAAEERAVLGETPNLAARLQGLAQPDCMVVSAATERLVQGLFECEALGSQQVKGIAQPVQVFRVLGESSTPSRFEVTAKRGLTPLVGREEEIGLLMKRWEQAVDGESQVVLLAGEAGLGKSRISRGFRDRLEGTAHRRVQYYGSPYHRNSAFYPVVGQLERGLRFDRTDDAQAKLQKLETLLAEFHVPFEETAWLLGSMLSLAVEGRYRQIDASPQLLKRKTFEAMLVLIEAMAKQQPVLMLIEDAHWIDPSTLEMLTLFIQRLRKSRILLLVTYRPGFEPPGGGRANVTALTLNRLSRKESRLVIARVAAGKALPDAVVEQILDRTDGVPLFIEEMTKSTLESGLLQGSGDGHPSSGSLPAVAIPASVQDSLMERLDRLGPVKEVAQLAAMLGRTFSRDLLAAVSPFADAELDSALARLVEAELLYPRTSRSEAGFEFKHALVQDAAYQSLLKKTRRQHHARIARVLETEFAQMAESEPELLAYHYTEAGLAISAVEYWYKAGQLAMRRSANVEAEGHLRKGLEVLRTLPETAERHHWEIALQNALGVCLMPTRGWGDPEVAGAFSRAASICELERDARGLFVALRGMGQYQMISGDLRTAREQTRRILQLAESADDPGLLIEAHHLGWSALTFTGEFEAAKEHAETVIELYDRDRDHSLTYIYSGHDPGVCCRSFGSLALWQLGFPDQALSLCRAGESLAQALSHPFSVAVALWAKGMLHLLRREVVATLETGDAIVAHCSEKGILPFVPLGKILHGGAMAEQGQVAAGLDELRTGIAGMQGSRTRYTLPLFVAWLAELCARGGLVDEGFGALEQGFAMCEDSADRFTLPELQRVKGQLKLAQSAQRAAEAEVCFGDAIDTAHGQNAKSLELRAAVDLARLWGEMGRRTEARDVLNSVYGCFTEGFETTDLRQAKALLAELA